MKTIALAFAFLMVSTIANAQYFKGRKYRELIESDTLSYSRLPPYDSVFYSHRISYKAHELRFYKYNDSAASIVINSEMYNIPLHVKFINEDGIKVYEPLYIKYISIDDTSFKGEVAAIMHNEKENWFFFGLRNDIRNSFYLFYEPLESDE